MRQSVCLTPYNPAHSLQNPPPFVRDRITEYSGLEGTHYDHLLSLLRKQNVMINNSTPFLKTGSTSSVFRTPHSPAGLVNMAVQGLQCVIV